MKDKSAKIETVLDSIDRGLTNIEHSSRWIIRVQLVFIATIIFVWATIILTIFFRSEIRSFLGIE